MQFHLPCGSCPVININSSLCSKYSRGPADRVNFVYTVGKGRRSVTVQALHVKMPVTQILAFPAEETEVTGLDNTL